MMNFVNPANNPATAAMTAAFTELTEALADLKDSTERNAEAQRLSAERARDLSTAQKRANDVLGATVTAISAIQRIGSTGNPHFASGYSSAGNLALAGVQGATGNITGAFASVVSAAVDLRNHFENLARAASPDKLAFLDKARQLEAAAAGFAAMPAKINEAMLAMKTARETRGMGMFDRFTYWAGGFAKTQSGDEKVRGQAAIVAEMERALGGKAGVGSAESLYAQVQNAGLQTSPLDVELMKLAQEQLDIQKRQLAELERANNRGFFR